MPWRFVGRTAQVESLARTLAQARPGPLLLTGEPGLGRTTLLHHAVGRLDPRRDAVFRIGPVEAATRPFEALRALLPAHLRASTVTSDTIGRAADGLRAMAGGRRLVLVADDAHRLDAASVLVLRAAHREHGAVLLLTHPTPTAGRARTPLDALAAEPGARRLALPPLPVSAVGELLAGLVGGPVHPDTVIAVHLATGGSPGLLRELAFDHRMTENMVWHNGSWQLSAWPETRVTASGRGGRRVLAAVRASWRRLAVDRVRELCKIALAGGAEAEVAAPWAFTLLLDGRVDDGIRFLNSVDATEPEAATAVAISRAVLLAFGLGRVDEATALLAVPTPAPEVRRRLLAWRAWLLATTGQPEAAGAALAELAWTGDAEATVYAEATLAAIAVAHHRPGDAVRLLRRSITGARAHADALPWLAPCLTANLVDALLLAGRIDEANSAALEFHAENDGRGCQVAGALAALVSVVPVKNSGVL